MERLTYEIMDGGMVTDKENVKEFEIEDWVTVYAGNAVFRLAEYEDTGLTPPEIMELKERDTAEYLENKKHTLRLRFGTCPKCKTRVSDIEGGNFCQNCGQRLKWED